MALCVFILVIGEKQHIRPLLEVHGSCTNKYTVRTYLYELQRV